MSHIREKATESEAVVQNIMKDIQALDLPSVRTQTNLWATGVWRGRWCQRLRHPVQNQSSFSLLDPTMSLHAHNCSFQPLRESDKWGKASLIVNTPESLAQSCIRSLVLNETAWQTNFGDKSRGHLCHREQTTAKIRCVEKEMESTIWGRCSVHNKTWIFVQEYYSQRSVYSFLDDDGRERVLHPHYFVFAVGGMPNMPVYSGGQINLHSALYN